MTSYAKKNVYDSSEYLMSIADKLLSSRLNEINEITNTATNKTNKTHKSKKALDSLKPPSYAEHDLLVQYNYTIEQLKYIASFYKLKVGGTKPQLLSRVYGFLLFSNSACKIQSVVRGYLFRKYLKSHGPAVMKRNLCTNTFDFLSMDQIDEIPLAQFYSFKDDDDFIYGCDIISLHNLIYNQNGNVKNPFTNKPLGKKVIDDFRTLLRLSIVQKVKIQTEVEDVTQTMSEEKNVEMRALQLFQHMDSLGNYTNSNWFLQLNRNQIIKYYKELIDVWQYRAHLTDELRRSICPPHGNPFRTHSSHLLLVNIESLNDIRNIILGSMEKMVNSSENKDNKYLGSQYVLSALTLVSSEAAAALPWLYEAVCYN